ncbi:MAG: hypothetical protein M0006_12150 [Magnetospirillum sp.]|nr:hypothetical protein [Magnetospirillum sp.]
MAKDAGDIRTIGVRGTEFHFERSLPAKERKVGERKLAALWVAPLAAAGGGALAAATVHEFDDGILYGPSSIPGVFSDFPGAAAAEVTVRWLELTSEQLVIRAKRQRDIMMAAAGVIAAIAIVAISFR